MLEMDTSRMSGPDHSMDSHEDTEHGMHTMMVTPELMGMLPGGSSRLGMKLFKYVCDCVLDK